MRLFMACLRETEGKSLNHRPMRRPGPGISHEFGFLREISSKAPDKKKARWIAMLLRVSATYTLPYSGES